MPLNWNACRMKRRVWSEKKNSTRRCPYCFRYRNAHRVSSQIREKKIKNLKNRRSRRRTRSIGRSKKTPAVNHLEAKAVSHRQELITAEISLFQTFGQWREERERKKIWRKKGRGRGREEARSHLCPTLSLNFFLFTSLCAEPHDLAWVVQRLDSAIHRINLCAVDSAISFPNTYTLDGDLSGGQRHPT